jgi:hypothetical protein
MSETTPVPAPRGRRLRPQFSLRVVLVLFVVCGVGFAICHYWPYEQSEISPQNPEVRIATTWQQTWSGAKAQVAESRYFREKRIRLESFENGVLHGPYEGSRDGYRQSGDYRHGKKHGIWKKYTHGGQLWESSEWQEGVLHGAVERVVEYSPVPRPNLPTETWAFDEGRLVAFQGQPVESRLFAQLPKIEAAAPKVAKRLNRRLERVRFRDKPLRAVAANFIRSGIPVEIDRALVDPQTPVSVRWEGVDYVSALVLLGLENDLGCVYRYGVIWITTPEQAREWPDPTGVEPLSEEADTLSIESWNEATSISAVRRPLSDLLKQIALTARVTVDVNAVERAASTDPDRFVITQTTNTELPFKHALGMLLYKARCRCELRGETLVILPAE